MTLRVVRIGSFGAVIVARSGARSEFFLLTAADDLELRRQLDEMLAALTPLGEASAT